MATIPHEVVGVEVGSGSVEGTLAKLKEEFVGACVGRISDTAAPLVASDIIPVFGAEIKVDGGAIIFVASDADNLFACG